MSRKKQKKTYYDDDDGRVIAPMNVEGMPWYAPKPKKPEIPGEQPAQLSQKEERLYRRAALRAGLLVAGIYGICGFIVIVIILLVCHAL
ncbi:MAG: hypothetical protein IJL87_01035 [Clostridia bacterium]|nr:hypothetical protein [Clostridia bacterium]